MLLLSFALIGHNNIKCTCTHTHTSAVFFSFSFVRATHSSDDDDDENVALIVFLKERTTREIQLGARAREIIARTDKKQQTNEPNPLHNVNNGAKINTRSLAATQRRRRRPIKSSHLRTHKVVVVVLKQHTHTHNHTYRRQSGLCPAFYKFIASSHVIHLIVCLLARSLQCTHSLETRHNQERDKLIGLHEAMNLVA